MWLRSFLILVLVSLSVAGIGAPVVHFGPTPAWVVPVKPNDEQPNLREISDGYYLQLYEEEVNVAQDESYQHMTRCIVSDAGVQGASNISINFNPAYEQLTVHQITVWRDGQPIDKLHKEAFKVIANEQDLSMFIYNGNYTAYVILDDIRKGDKIEYSYTTSGSNPIFNKKFFTSLTFQGSDPIGHVHYYIVAPASRTFNFKYFNDAKQPAVTKADNTARYEWDELNVKGRPYSDKVPSWFTPLGYVQISEYKDWNEVVDWAYKINTPDNVLKGSLSKRVAELKTKYAEDKAGLIRAIANIVQNEVRYMGVEIGPYSHKANSPVKVYEQRYGDCKDKSLLLVSMLHNAGIDAEVALVNTTERAKIAEYLPMPSVFNHAIVVAHLDGKDIWIDATISYQGGTGTDIYFPDYGKALVLGPGGTEHLVSVPDMPGGEITYTETYDITNEHASVPMVVNTTYSGSMADDIRRSYASQSKSELEKSFLDYYSKTYPQIQRKDSLVINDDKPGNMLETIERYTVEDFFEFDSANQNYSAGFYAGMIRNALPLVENKKEYPLAVAYPYSIKYVVKVNAEINWDIPHKSETIERNAYRFSYDISTETGSLTIAYHFTFLKDHIAPEEMAQYEKDRKKITGDLLSYSFTYTPEGMGKTESEANILGMLVFIALIAGCAYAGNRIYKTRTYPQMHPFEPKAIGGWLILPVIGLIYTVCNVLYYLFSSGFFSTALWHSFDNHKESAAYKVLLAIELAGNTVMMSLAAFCLVLIYNKRDILPKYIKILYVGSFALIVLDSVMARIIFPTNTVDYRGVSRALIAMCIWVPYFTQSRRVSETFIVGYPERRYGAYVPVPETMAEKPQDSYDRWQRPDIETPAPETEKEPEQPKNHDRWKRPTTGDEGKSSE